MLITDQAPLSDDQARAVSDARMDMLRFRDGHFERVVCGEWVRCEAAAPLAKQGLLELFKDPFDDMACRVRPTQAGLNAIGVLSPAQIMARDLGDKYNDMVVSGRSWTKERGDAARETVGPDADWAAWQAALGVPSELLLTGDAGTYDRDGGWCRCEAGHDEWVRFQRWSERGLEGHGFLHAGCRRLLQSG